VSVSIDLSGANPIFADAVTNTNGQVVFTWTGTNPGVDVVEFAGVIDGEIARCSATKTWVASPTDVHDRPGHRRQLRRHPHAVTVRVAEPVTASAAPSVPVDLTVISGPNAAPPATGPPMQAATSVCSIPQRLGRHRQPAC